MKIPNFKIQIPNKFQAPNSNGRATFPTWSLNFEVWNLFGIWILGFGFFPHE